MGIDINDNGRKGTAWHVEQAVSLRYSAASQVAEKSLCCSVEYDRQLLAVLPEEIITRDYGCGDPSRHVARGETVLDLGSGGGKICYIASQIVGQEGRVIGVDMNDDMLVLARTHQAEISQRIGWNNVQFHKGRIQDLALDLERFETWLAEHPVRSAAEWLNAQQQADNLRSTAPMIPDNSVDVIISNCVLNLVNPQDRSRLFAELFRVLRPGGRAVISDIVSDRPVPGHLRNDPHLWSGCVSGAFVEPEFVEQFAGRGFYAVELMARQQEPWTVVEGIEFRSVTVRAYKPSPQPSREMGHSVVYRGPWRRVVADDGTELQRGVPTAVTDQSFYRFSSEPYRSHLYASSASDASSLPQLCCAPGTKCC